MESPATIPSLSQALGNSVAAVALVDSVLAELAASRAPHLLPLAASTLQVGGRRQQTASG